MSRADRFSLFKKTPEYYSDILINLDMIPVTGLLARATNEDAVKQSIRNLILTDRTERPYQPYVGSKVRTLLFEPVDLVTSEMLKTTITETIKRCEPRADLIEVQVLPRNNEEAYWVNILFRIINIPNTNFDLTVVLNRIR